MPSLKKLQTLKNRSDFEAMNRKARKVSSRGVVLQAMPNDTGIIRVGYTVTKKTQALATKRNRIKRRLRAAADLIIREFAQPSCDYVLIGRAEAETRPFDELCGDLKWCLEKTGFFKVDSMNRL